MRPPLIISLVFAIVGCARRPAEPDAFAVAAVDAARTGALAASWTDDALADQLRRVQLWRRVPVDRASPGLLAALYARDPEGEVPFAERARAHRERAARNLRSLLDGSCTARRDDELRRARIASLTTAVAQAPPAANAEMAALAARLAGAIAVRVECERGVVAVTLVPGDPWRVVDLFAPPTTELVPLPLATR